MAERAGVGEGGRLKAVAAEAGDARQALALPQRVGEERLAVPVRAGAPHPLAEVRAEAWAKVAELLQHVRSASTRRVYAIDLAYFWTWAEATYRQAPSYPAPEGWVVEFVADHAGEGELAPEVRDALARSGSRRPGGKAIATLCRRVAALSTAHELLGFSDTANPCRSKLVRESLRAARRRAVNLGQRPKQAKALILEDLVRLVATCEGPEADLVDLRDRALLLFGWGSGGRRRSEIVAANVEDLERVGGEWVYRLRMSKTDQEGKGRVLPLKGKVGRALREWLDAAGIREGAIFRPVVRCGRGRRDVRVRRERLDAEVVAAIVRERARRAGLPDWEQCGGHSLRSGFVTDSGLNGDPIGATMALTGHRSVAMIAQYQRFGDALGNPAAGRVVEDGAGGGRGRA